MNNDIIKEALEKSLKLGRELRETSDLIKCTAIVEFEDGSNWQPLYADIPTEGINEQGYVEEVWIYVDEHEEDVNGKIYSVLSHGYTTFLYGVEARIDRFRLDGWHILRPAKNCWLDIQ